MAEFEKVATFKNRFAQCSICGQIEETDHDCEKQARENPKPLTLEQLKQREGKPVWVVVNSDLPNRWGLVDWINNKIIMAGSYFVRPNEVEEGKIKVFEHEPKEV